MTQVPRLATLLDLVTCFPSFLLLRTVADVFKGLGLAVVARIIEQLGGQLRVDSKSNEGSTFSFLIPFGTHSPSSDKDSSLHSFESESRKDSATSVSDLHCIDKASNS